MIIVDSHVHFYGSFDLSGFLESAYTNFMVEARRRGKGDFDGVLLLTERVQDNWFNQIRQDNEFFRSLQKSTSRIWTLQPTEENISLIAEGPAGERIFIVSGRQVVTAEKLELLVLFTDRNFENGLSFRELVRDVNEEGEVAVIPWGTAKWLGKRGRFLKEFLINQGEVRFFLGDNGGRPNFWPEPSHFKLARQRGVSILHGTDPLPLAGEANRPGSFGFFIRDTLSSETPAKELKEILVTQENEIENYGNFESGYRFLVNQLLLRLPGRRSF